PFVGGAWWPATGALQLGGHTRGLAAYKQGWQSWSYAGGLPPGTSDPRPRVPTNVVFQLPRGPALRLPFPRRVDVVGEELAMLGPAGEPVALLAGFLDARRWLGQVYVDRRAGALAAGALLDETQLAAGARLEAPPLLLALGRQSTLLELYAAHAAAEQG